MKWNWQQIDWPHFQYQQKVLQTSETDFIRNSGIFSGTYQHINEQDKKMLIVELISNEAIKTSEIEGEYLDRDSVQSSIRRNLGLPSDNRKIPPAEQGIAEVMTDLYNNFTQPLTHQTLFKWNEMLNYGRRDLHDIGRYRTHPEPMQVVSGKIDEPQIHFEAPPSQIVPKEMNIFVQWFNNTAPNGSDPLPALTRAGITHLYFVCIHPFEDGNGRIARALVEKVLSQDIKKPILTTLSTLIQKNRKDYYDILEKSNKKNEITPWLLYFSKTILDAQKQTQQWINFLIEKTKLYDRLRDNLNPRQEKALARIFREGLTGFTSGLSAENYIAITKTTRATATRDLHDLVTKGALLRTGKLKSTRYWLNILKE